MNHYYKAFRETFYMLGCLFFWGGSPKTHKLESANFQFVTDDNTFSQLGICFDSVVCRIKQQNHDTTVSD